MAQREKLLLIGFLSVLVLWQGGPIVYRTIFGPIDERQSQVSQLTARIRDKDDKELAIIRAQAHLKNAQELSLPPDELDAQRLYQQWLTDLAQLAALKDLKVTPGRRVAQKQTWSGVQVGVEGVGTLEQLAAFLFHFHRSAILHRIVQLSTDSPASEGDPQLKIQLIAEGLALRDAPERARLFPETTLQHDLSRDAAQISVADADAFPRQPGFRIRLGNEYATVTGINGSVWSVARGVDHTTPASHHSGERIELAPLHPQASAHTFDHYRQMLASSPFTKPDPPRKYNPSLAPISNQVAVRGTPWSLRVKPNDLNPALGPPQFILSESHPAGMQINAETGEITWDPPESLAAGEYPVTVFLRQADNSAAPLSQSFRIVLREPNAPPVIANIGPQSLYLGRTLSLQIQATDDIPGSRLTYKLSGTPPAGASIDETTGQLTWAPEAGLAPGDYALSVTVADNGSPPQSTSLTIPVTVREDVAVFTYFIGSVARDSVQEAWLYDRSSDRRWKIKQDETFQVADISARVKEIGKSRVVFEADQFLWELSLGQNLRAMRPLGAIEPPPTLDSSTETTAESPTTADPPVAAAPPTTAESPTTIESDPPAKASDDANPGPAEPRNTNPTEPTSASNSTESGGGANPSPPSEPESQPKPASED